MAIPFKYFSAAFLVFCLSGCYESDKAVISKGEKTPISGSFVCKNGISGKQELRTITEKSEGMWPFQTFSYSDGSGTPPDVYKKLSGNFFLGQQKTKSGKFGYYYIDVIDKDSFVGLLADAMSKAPYIEALAKKHNVGLSSANRAVLLSGDASSTLSFLSAHDKTLLSAVLSCHRK